MSDRPYLGVGWSFPIAFDSGRVRAVSGEAAVEQSIRVILSTALGERILRPEFGCGLHAEIFTPGVAESTGRLIGEIQLALTRWEPRIDLLDVIVHADPTHPNRRLIEVEARVRATNSRFNAVYPFYLDNGATESSDV